MKKLLFALMLITSQLNAQTKDTTIAVTMPLNQFKALLATIDASIDSKRLSKELLDFLQANARIIDLSKKEEPKKAVDNKAKQ